MPSIDLTVAQDEGSEAKFSPPDRSRSAGIDGYLAKPFTQDQFLTSVKKIAKRRTAV